MSDDKIDVAMQAAWEALESGDIDGARKAASALKSEEAAAMEIVMLEAACDREEGNVESALARLTKAAETDPDWCTPELWMAEILADVPGGQAEALRHARKAVDLADDEDEFLAAIGCKAAIELEMDRPADARATLKELPSADVPLDDPMVALEFAHLLAEAENLDEAKKRLDVLVDGHPDFSDAWYLQGVLAERAGDEKAKVTAWLKTRELDLADADAPGHSHSHDGEGGHDHDHGDCLHLSESDVASIAEETLEAIPEELRNLLRDVPVIVADLPAAADVQQGADPRALGLFHGATQAEQSAQPALTEIVLYRKNIERVAHDEESAREEVETTLLHEAGHFFGLDEKTLARLGLE